MSVEGLERINSEWVALSAIRGMAKIAAKGDTSKATYNDALELGAEIYPELLGAESSILRREHESDTAREYRQRAILKTIQQQAEVRPEVLLKADIDDLEDLLRIAKHQRDNKAKVDQLKRKLSMWKSAEQEITPVAHTENQLIFRDAMAVERVVPALRSGKSYRDFRLPTSEILRVRVLHPDKPEHITGADIIYEIHSPNDESARLVVVQYKIWDKKVLPLNDARMRAQINRMKAFCCTKGICANSEDGNTYRFPCCSGFLRPTDKLQKANQAFISSGQHLPLCHIDRCKSKTPRGVEVLELKNMRGVSLTSEMFEALFNKEKIGSRKISYDELRELYRKHTVATESDTVVIYAQEFSDCSESKEVSDFSE